MRRFHLGKVVLLVLLPFFAVALASAVTPNPKLISLVPSTAQIVAGMIAPQRGSQPSSLLLITHRNQIDLNDFTALSGVDGSRIIEQIVLVASNGGAALSEHSLLVSGHFDRVLIYKSAQSAGGAMEIQYRGIAVLEMEPFARERETFHDVRWLAVMDSKLAVFGTRDIVRQELDRYLARSAVYPALERRLAHLRGDDATWCVATLPYDNSEIQAAFRILDSRLAELLRAGDTLEFGIHYGRQVEFEYEVGMSSRRDPEAVSRTLMPVSTAAQPNAAFALPAAELTRSDGGVRGVLKVPRARYEVWRERVLAAQGEHAATDPSKR